MQCKNKSDTDMYLFIEKGIRGGISYIAKRFSKANNKYIQSYDNKKPRLFIVYLDVNNLYGWGMSQYLPYGGFKWLNQKEIDKFNVNSIGGNSFDGYIYKLVLIILMNCMKYIMIIH